MSECLLIGDTQAKEFIDIRLSEGYDYAEAVQFSVLAHNLLKAQDLCIEVPVEGKDYRLSLQTVELLEDFFHKCEEGINVFEAFVKVFYPVGN